ncbi:hypothetical protein G9F72_007440 [Clostridium estertheticum]|uniref:hypothetical protein n=1 Tax=Clostridium estertheticum TaxID=238834 RepID=UPI0013E8FE9A|nr:hypothetical protein [Clostridium estertheticum]MBZ9686163.1 hypothetical protein [Clostridium estertheticum]
MKRFYIAIIIILLFIFVGYSYFITTPKTINNVYKGIAYKLNDSKFSKNVIIKLDGQYNKKTKVFKGNLIINDKEYPQCTLSSATMWICYIENKRYLMGTVFTNANLDQMSFEISNEQLYYDLTKEASVNDKLIISVPSNNRLEAIKINNNLEQFGVIGKP